MNFNASSWPATFLAALVISFIGAYALIYPNTEVGRGAILALLPIAGAIGTYFFHQSSQNFLGGQLTAQRSAFIAQAQALSGNGPTGGTTTTSPPTSTSSNIGTTPAGQAPEQTNHPSGT